MTLSLDTSSDLHAPPRPLPVEALLGTAEGLDAHICSIAPADDLRRREFITGGVTAALVLAAGCSSDDDDGHESASSTTRLSSDARRRIRTPQGDFDIPLEPQRVVAIEPRLDVELCVALELPMVAIGGFTGSMQGRPVTPWVPLPDPDVPVLGGVDEDIESIAAQRPDLIVCTSDGDRGNLAQIAPLVAYDWDQPWRDIMRQVAGWLERGEDLDALIADFEDELAAVRARHADAIESAHVGILQIDPDGQFRSESTDSSFNHLQTLGELGGQQAPFLVRQRWTEPFSPERLEELEDAEALLLIAADPDAARRQLDDVPLWTRLPAVTRDRVLIAGQGINFGLLYTARESLRLLDELYALIER